MFPIRLLPVLLFVASTAAAQSYPAKPVRVIVPFPPSGGSDVIIRVFQPAFSAALGQQVVIDNRSGANGNIGTELAAHAAPDGYTLLFNGSGTLAINAALYSKLPFDVLRDFAPITLTVLQPHVVGVHPSVPARSIKELIALARSQPGRLNYASSGNGSLAHLAGEIFQSQAKVELVHIPYKGAAPALVDLVAGQVHLVFASSPSVMSHVKANRLRVLAVTTPKRVAALPDLPTVAESGLPGFQVMGWYGLLAPAGTPGAIVSRLNADMVSTLNQPDVRQKLGDLGLEVETTTPQGFGDFMKAEIAKYAKVVKAARITID
jgi:tripartite-type tricarboxylate transporter receptor subunit TctC